MSEESQVKHSDLIAIIKQCPEIMATLIACSEYGLPNYYLAGGSITQCVWNHLLGLPLLHRVKDFDVVYFADESIEIEKQHETRLNQDVSHTIPIDIKNQARVHEWYPRKFGNPIEPYSRSEDGIQSWLSAFAVGVRLENGLIKVFAPYGLKDTFAMHVRPNKIAMSAANYLKMTTSFRERWPQIKVESW